jgi:tRNA-2-methylthio-N6-dimethylallyladenosine synthase
MDAVSYDFAYMFSYSERPKTLAERRYDDDISEEVKKRRLTEVIQKQLGHSLTSNKKQIGTIQKVLVEGTSKRSDEFLCGRTGRNSMVVFPKEQYRAGQYVMVQIEDCSSATLHGKVVELVESQSN